MTTRVFFSYSHDSPEHMDAVLGLSNRLRQGGVDCALDQYQTSPRGGWPRWTMRQLEDADFILIVCSETYFRRFTGAEAIGTGRGAKWEGAIITQQLYGAEQQMAKFVPILRSPADERFLPLPLRGLPFFTPFDDSGFLELYRHLTNQPAVEKPELGEVQSLPPRKRRYNFVALDAAAATDTAPAITRPAAAMGPPRPDRRRLRLWLVLLAVVVAAAITSLLYLGPSGTSEDGPPFSVRAKYFSTLPYALRNTLSAKDFLYWLHLEVVNRTERPVLLEIRCEVLNTPKPAVCNEKVASYTVQPRGHPDSHLTRRVDPRLQFLSKDSFEAPLALTIEWKIRDDMGSTLWQDTAEITLVPKNRFYWELENTAGETVDQRFLVATLAAWTITSERDPAYLAGAEISATTSSMDEYMRRLYAEILTNPARLTLTPALPVFPPKVFEELDYPKRLLQGGVANPVEAALLVGALSQEAVDRFAARLVGMLSPHRDDGSRSLFVAWAPQGSNTWQVLDFTDLGASFKDNAERAASRLGDRFLTSVVPELDESGVYLDLDERRVALDFRRARDVHSIQGLP